MYIGHAINNDVACSSVQYHFSLNAMLFPTFSQTRAASRKRLFSSQKLYSAPPCEYLERMIAADLIDWSSVLLSNTVESAWSSFKEIYTKVLDLVAPIKQVRIKQRTDPWITDEILNHIRERDQCLFKFRSTKYSTNYKLKRIFCYTCCRDSYCRYFDAV